MHSTVLSPHFGGGWWWSVSKISFGEGGHGEQAKPHFGGVGWWCQRVKPHFGRGGGGGGGSVSKPHLSWIGYYLEMEVIKKADTKLFSLFYISKGKSMQINCIFSKMTKIHNWHLSLTPYLDHLLKSDLHQNSQKVSQNTFYNRVVCILCYCITCSL